MLARLGQIILINMKFDTFKESFPAVNLSKRWILLEIVATFKSEKVGIARIRWFYRTQNYSLDLTVYNTK
jgi:hypothetical protein